jgi:hypothetical protein
MMSDKETFLDAISTDETPLGQDAMTRVTMVQSSFCINPATQMSKAATYMRFSGYYPAGTPQVFSLTTERALGAKSRFTNTAQLLWYVANELTRMPHDGMALVKLGLEHGVAAHRSPGPGSRWLFFDPNGVLILFVNKYAFHGWIVRELPKADEDEDDRMDYAEVHLFRPRLSGRLSESTKSRAFGP